MGYDPYFETFFVTGDLDIGIGTETPISKLQVVGSLHVDGAWTNYNNALPDMGVISTSDLRGYGTDYISDKRMSNCLIGSNSRTENGGLRVDVTADPDTFDIYLGGIWQSILYDLTVVSGELEHTPFDQTIDVWSGYSNLKGLNSIPIIQEYQTSMGSMPPKPTIDCGTF